MMKSICTGILLAVFGLSSTAVFACGCVDAASTCPCKSAGNVAPQGDGKAEAAAVVDPAEKF